MSSSKPLTIELKYQPPYDWRSVLSFYRSHEIPYLEAVDDVSFQRVIETTGGLGWFQVFHEAKRKALRVSMWNGDKADLARVAGAVRRMFDLDADPAVVGAAMAADSHLNAIWQRNPGLRVSRAWSGFESMMTTVLGQLVSVSFGRVLIRELMHAAGSRATHPKTNERIYLFPTAKRILRADLSAVRTSPMRRTTLQSLAALASDEALNWRTPIPAANLKKTLRAVGGVGPWTAEYVAMRGFGDNDAFPATDYGLKQEIKRHPQTDPNRVRPWRAYAAIALWKSFAEHKLTSPSLSGE
jgi:DNA-3-methyladenine glycosylase II